MVFVFEEKNIFQFPSSFSWNEFDDQLGFLGKNLGMDTSLTISERSKGYKFYPPFENTSPFFIGCFYLDFTSSHWKHSSRLKSLNLQEKNLEESQKNPPRSYKPLKELF